jgi:predicted transcriptional regulator
VGIPDRGRWATEILPRRDVDGRFNRMSQKELVLEAIQELPDDASIDQIADRVEFMAAIQKGIDDIDRGDTIPHEEIKKQLATWLTE